MPLDTAIRHFSDNIKLIEAAHDGPPVASARFDESANSTDELKQKREGEAVLRTFGIGAQILRDLGIKRMRVLSAPKQMHGISGFDLEISEYVER